MDGYTCVGTLGQGSFGVVSKIRRKSDGRDLVWKELNYGLMNEREKQQIVAEVNILRELRHPYIVRYYDRIIDKATTKLFIVMEHCAGGDLASLIKRYKAQGKYIDETRVMRMLCQIVLALKECHGHSSRVAAGIANGRGRSGDVTTRRPILHRDLKPANVLLDGAGNVKLGDFGLAKELSSESRLAQTNLGTPYYMAPEIVNEKQYDERADIWAAGCITYEAAALSPPFEAQNQLALAIKITSERVARLNRNHYSSELCDVVQWMLEKDMAKRPRLSELEALPKLRPLMLEAQLTVRDHQMQYAYAAKMKEISRREEELTWREQRLGEREKRVADREREALALGGGRAAAAAAAAHLHQHQQHRAPSGASAAANQQALPPQQPSLPPQPSSSGGAPPAPQPPQPPQPPQSHAPQPQPPASHPPASHPPPSHQPVAPAAPAKPSGAPGAAAGPRKERSHTYHNQNKRLSSELAVESEANKENVRPATSEVVIYSDAQDKRPRYSTGGAALPENPSVKPGHNRAVTAAVTAAHRRAPLQAIAQAQPNPSLNNAQSQMAFAKPQKPSGGGGGAPSSERGFTSKPMRY